MPAPSTHVKGIILKINSPGGSPVQSARIWSSIREMKQEHEDIPLYAVIEDVGASGAYFIAAAADEIYANESSIVGSIGVRMGQFGFVGTLEKLGIERRVITAGKNKTILDETVERSLKGAALWDEVKDRLQESALGLSGGQMQRLCIARAIAVNPEVILMDEPCSALDPKSTARVEELIGELREDFTIIIVTHNMQQAARVSDYTAFLFEGALIEYGLTDKMFMKPNVKQTEDYITGRFG